MAEGLPIAVRSGGHCFEDFVDSAQTQSIIDVSRMNQVRWDENYRRSRYERRLPSAAPWLGRDGAGGTCLGVGVHISGGGYGPLSRRFGLVVDRDCVRH
jgi:FAD/FMN-containing dehydrogenase